VVFDLAGIPGKPSFTKGDRSPKYLVCSEEQVDESPGRPGPLWDQLSQAFRERIARVNQGQQESDQPVHDENRRGD
jgi:hypothetical protein